MNHIELNMKIEGFRTRNRQNNCYINKDIYRLFYCHDFYIMAYNNIKSNDGAETKGSDGTSLHGFCEEWIDEIISSLRDESYQPNPSKTIYIPKKNGKLRKLSFPNGKDKLIQEGIRIILESIYEPSFSNLSHGFRPKRSIHSAVAQIDTWRSTTWFLEGDISACFDEVDHRVLESILRERILDERFIRLINKLLKAGYLDTNLSFQNTKLGTGQGSICSPILANIYLDKLDRYMEKVIERDTLGNYRKQNPEYAKVRYALKKAIQNQEDASIKSLTKELKLLSSRDLMDSNFRRIRYVRYADDFLIGIIADKAYAEQLKSEIGNFLKEVLRLRLSDEKTKVTNATHDSAHFLGFHITKRKNRFVILMDTKQMIKKLHENGMCDTLGYPRAITKLLRLPIQDIIKYGNQVLRGLLHSQQGCHNFFEGWRIQYIIQYAIAKTIGRKHDMSMKATFKKFGNRLNYRYTNVKGIAQETYLAMYKSFRRNKEFFIDWLQKLKEPIEYIDNKKNPLSKKCYVCGDPQQTKMYHRRRKSLINQPYPHIIKEMIRINRRQICLCPTCFKQVENNQLEYNQITKLRKLY
ncbi:MAG: reverse transcriptase domain-containing protein [Turicibacter sp.]